MPAGRSQELRRPGEEGGTWGKHGAPPHPPLLSVLSTCYGMWVVPVMEGARMRRQIQTCGQRGSRVCLPQPRSALPWAPGCTFGAPFLVTQR